MSKVSEFYSTLTWKEKAELYNTVAKDYEEIKRMNMVGHYVGEIGDFYYSQKEWVVKRDDQGDYLFYIGNGENVIFPDGCKTCRKMFLGFDKDYLDLDMFDPYGAEDMSYMFSGCKLEKIDLHNFNTSKVRNMKRMFEYCVNVKFLNMKSFNTKRVENMSGMFYGCKKLEEVNISSFNTMSVKDMSEMFMDCTHLISLDISNFVATSLVRKDNIFRHCGRIALLDIGDMPLEDDYKLQRHEFEDVLTELKLW